MFVICFVLDVCYLLVVMCCVLFVVFCLLIGVRVVC